MQKQRNHQFVASYTLRYRWKLLPRERSIPASLSYIVEGDRIRLPGNPGGVKFDFPIGDVVEAEDIIVLCLLVPEGRRCSENVYAIDRSGNLRWRISPQPFDARHGSYVALSLQGSVLKLHARDGHICSVDSKNGTPRVPSSPNQ